jgi:hypothetical protein
MNLTTLRAVDPVAVPTPDEFPAPVEATVFPVEALPTVLKNGVNAMVEMVQCDPAMAGASY